MTIEDSLDLHHKIRALWNKGLDLQTICERLGVHETTARKYKPAHMRVMQIQRCWEVEERKAIATFPGSLKKTAAFFGITPGVVAGLRYRAKRHAVTAAQ